MSEQNDPTDQIIDWMNSPVGKAVMIGAGALFLIFFIINLFL